MIALYLQMMQRIKLSPLWHHLFKNHDTASNKTLTGDILLKQGNIPVHRFDETNNLQCSGSHCLFYGGIKSLTGKLSEWRGQFIGHHNTGRSIFLWFTFLDIKSLRNQITTKIAHLLAFTPSLEQCTKSTPDWTSTKSHGGCKHPHIHILIKTKKPWYGCCMLDLSSTFIGYYTLGINYPCASQYAEYNLEAAGWCTWSPRVVS